MKESTFIERNTKMQPAWLTVLRVVLGLVLFWKGIVFVRDTELLKVLIQNTGVGIFSENSEVLFFIIAYLTLLCGLFILSGLFTRLSCIIQIPIVFIATFFVNVKRMGESNFEMILSLVVLVLLFFFAIKGGGSLSADEFFRSYYKIGGTKKKIS
ncbi:MAG: DoxX family membrane protein [Ginsengibacter sp.]